MPSAVKYGYPSGFGPTWVPLKVYKACNILVYRNGDNSSPSKRVPISPLKETTMQLVYRQVTECFGRDATYFVRGLYTINGDKVKGVDELRDGEYYVASSGKYTMFKPMDYKGIDERIKRLQEAEQENRIQVKLPPPGTLPPPDDGMAAKCAASKYKDISEPLIIFVYGNGNVLEPAKKFALDQKDLASWGRLLQTLSAAVNLPRGPVIRLYHLKGKFGDEVWKCDQLKPWHYYVAVSYDEFKWDYPYGQPEYQRNEKNNRQDLMSPDCSAPRKEKMRVKDRAPVNALPKMRPSAVPPPTSNSHQRLGGSSATPQPSPDRMNTTQTQRDMRTKQFDPTASATGKKPKATKSQLQAQHEATARLSMPRHTEVIDMSDLLGTEDTQRRSTFDSDPYRDSIRPASAVSITVENQAGKRQTIQPGNDRGSVGSRSKKSTASTIDQNDVDGQERKSTSFGGQRVSKAPGAQRKSSASSNQRASAQVRNSTAVTGPGATANFEGARPSTLSSTGQRTSTRPNDIEGTEPTESQRVSVNPDNSSRNSKVSAQRQSTKSENTRSNTLASIGEGESIGSNAMKKSRTSSAAERSSVKSKGRESSKASVTSRASSAKSVSEKDRPGSSISQLSSGSEASQVSESRNSRNDGNNSHNSSIASLTKRSTMKSTSNSKKSSMAGSTPRDSVKSSATTKTKGSTAGIEQTHEEEAEDADTMGSGRVSAATGSAADVEQRGSVKSTAPRQSSASTKTNKRESTQTTASAKSSTAGISPRPSARSTVTKNSSTAGMKQRESALSDTQHSPASTKSDQRESVKSTATTKTNHRDSAQTTSSAKSSTAGMKQRDSALSDTQYSSPSAKSDQRVSVKSTATTKTNNRDSAQTTSSAKSSIAGMKQRDSALSDTQYSSPSAKSDQRVSVKSTATRQSSASAKTHDSTRQSSASRNSDTQETIKSTASDKPRQSRKSRTPDASQDVSQADTEFSISEIKMTNSVRPSRTRQGSASARQDQRDSTSSKSSKKLSASSGTKRESTITEDDTETVETNGNNRKSTASGMSVKSGNSKKHSTATMQGNEVPDSRKSSTATTSSKKSMSRKVSVIEESETTSVKTGELKSISSSSKKSRAQPSKKATTKYNQVEGQISA